MKKVLSKKCLAPAFFAMPWFSPVVGFGNDKKGAQTLASPQTSCGVRLSRIHFSSTDRGGEMNAWQTNPKGHLRGGYLDPSFCEDTEICNLRSVDVARPARFEIKFRFTYIFWRANA